MFEIFTVGFALLGAFIWWIIVLLPWKPTSTKERLESNLGLSVKQISNVTVLIPARNESASIERTLRSLSAQGENLPIVIVDDQSEDDTCKKAKNFPVTVISGKALPEGWSGKLWALEQGLAHVKTSYVLLLDADIELDNGMVATLLHKAEHEQLAFVSLMAELNMSNFSERLLMPAFVFFFKLLYPFQLSNNPRSKIAAAAGGCILVKREALHKIGAFNCLRDALIDDCTLANRIKQAGFLTWTGLSRSVKSHREYQTILPIWNMVARTAYTQLNYSIFWLLICTLLMVSLFWFAPVGSFLVKESLGVMIGLFTWAALFVAYIPTLRFYRRSLLWVVTLPLIGCLFLLMTWTSALRYWRGERALWKNRRYEISL
ncbi:MAG: glycosyltransferase [Nitrosomonas sp.]|nr:glycosyltransferase [Nitrosomonas sp.]